MDLRKTGYKEGRLHKKSHYSVVVEPFTRVKHCAVCLKMLARLLALALSAAVALAALPSGTVTCGSNKYSVSAIEAAINAGVKDLNSGNLPGGCFCSESLFL